MMLVLHLVTIIFQTVQGQLSVNSFPLLLFGRSSHVIVEGSVLLLYCKVYPPSSTVKITWNKNNTPIHQDVPHIRMRNFTSVVSSTLRLMVDNFRISDNGMYQCTAQDGESTGSGSALTLTAIPSTINGSLRVIKNDAIITTNSFANRTGYQVGETASHSFEIGHITDNFIAYSPPSVMWIKDGTSARTVPINTPGINGRINTTLSFTFQESDAGIYQCIFTGVNSELFITIPIRLDTGGNLAIERVSAPVIILRPPEKLVLEVRASGLYHTISWVKDERVFGRFGLSFAHPIHYPEELPNFLEMFIREPTMTTDMGVYEVGLTRIRDLSANIPNDILFSVIAAEDTTTVTNQISVLVVEGDSLNISCSSVGVPVPTITWRHNNHTTGFNQTDLITPVDVHYNNQRTLITSVTSGRVTSTLHIVNIQYLEHHGVYECIGDNSDGRISISSVNITVLVQVLYCFSPLPLLVNSYAGKEINHTFHANATVNIQCDHGYVPFSPIDITCISNSILSSHTWVPDPSNLCFPLEATANLTLIRHRRSRPGIDCPGDTMSYQCSIQSNAPDPQLTWVITFPQLSPIKYTYHNDDLIDNTVMLDMNISISLRKYASNGSIESVIELTLLSGITMNGTLLECNIHGYAKVTENILVNLSVPLTPVNFAIREKNNAMLETVVSFEWDIPQGFHAEDIYLITITPAPTIGPRINKIYHSPFNVTLAHNIEYNISIAALNCVGESGPHTFKNIQIIGCGHPSPPINGSLGNYQSTAEGTSINFQCDDGHTVMATTCTKEGRWSLAPDIYCTDQSMRESIERALFMEPILLPSILAPVGILLFISTMITSFYCYTHRCKQSRLTEKVMAVNPSHHIQPQYSSGVSSGITMVGSSTATGVSESRTGISESRISIYDATSTSTC